MAKTSIPKSVTEINTYAELRAIAQAYEEGKLPFVMIIGGPGLSKSTIIKNEIGYSDGFEGLFIQGRKSDIDFYCDLYHFRDQMVVITDSKKLLESDFVAGYAAGSH